MYLFLLSEKCGEALKNNLSRIGEIILVGQNKYFYEEESRHADMQLFKTGEKSIIAAPGFDNKAARMLAAYGIEVAYGKTVPERKYPRNISYNVINAGGCFVTNARIPSPR